MGDRFKDVPAEDLIRDIGRLARERHDYLTKRRTARQVLEAAVAAAQEACDEETAEARESMRVIDGEMQTKQIYCDQEISERHLHLVSLGLANKQLDTGYGYSKISEPDPKRWEVEVIDKAAFVQWAMENEPSLIDQPEPVVLKAVVNAAAKTWKASDGKFIDKHGVLVPGLEAHKPETNWNFK